MKAHASDVYHTAYSIVLLYISNTTGYITLLFSYISFLNCRMRWSDCHTTVGYCEGERNACSTLGLSRLISINIVAFLNFN